MKHYLTIIIFLSIYTTAAFGQAGSRMSYQAVLRDANQEILANQSIEMLIQILKGHPAGEIVYQEVHQLATNGNGLVTTIIGDGEYLSGSITEINWGEASFYIKTLVDPKGGDNYTLEGVTEVLSVPYAMYASRGGQPGPEGPQGIQGPQGLQGPQGTQGPEGPMGPQGEKGLDGSGVRIVGSLAAQSDLPSSYDGEVGDMYIIVSEGEGFVWDGQNWVNVGQIRGPQGSQGIQGPQGPQGAQGPVGPQGEMGAIGPQGPQGPQGMQGQVGPEGPKGDIGLTGPQGPQGVPGPEGMVGPQGPIGNPGPQGQQGIPGPEGPMGPQGVNGSSAYDLWLSQGNQGSLADFMLSLVGPAGEQGSQGPQGPMGAVGPMGPQGIQGSQGNDGPMGPQGPEGPIGAVGPVGPQGNQGPQGNDGPIGPQGPVGPVGPQGPQGPPGNSNGPAGGDLTGNFPNPVLASSSVTSAKIANGAVTVDKLANGNVTREKIALLSVDAGRIANGAVSEIKIADNALFSYHFTDNCVTNEAIAANSISTNKIQNWAITSSKIANGNVTSANIAVGNVTGNHLALNTVATENMVDLAITTAKLANGSVTADKLAPGVGGSNWVVSGNNIYRNSGRVGINTNNPSEYLDITHNNGSVRLGNTLFPLQINTTSNALRYMSMTGPSYTAVVGGSNIGGNNPRTVLGSLNNPVEIGRVTSPAIFIGVDDNVGIGAPSPEFKLHVDGRINTTSEIVWGGNIFMQRALGVQKLFMNTTLEPFNHSVHDLGSSLYRWRNIYLTNQPVVGSDARIKENVKEINYGLEAIKQLKPVQYNLIGSDKGEVNLGLIAQEVRTIIPEIVVINTEKMEIDKERTAGSPVPDDMHSLKYAELIPVLIKAVQEQSGIIEQLERRIQELESKD